MDASNLGPENRRVYCDHCQTTVVDDAPFCPSCSGKLTEAPGADVVDPSQAPTVALMVGPCESCGASSLPGSTLCLPCTRAFESILNAQPTAPMPGPVAPVAASDADAATLLQAPPALASTPRLASSPDAATVLTPPIQLPAPEDQDEYEDDADDLMGEEDATVLATAPPAAAPTETAQPEPLQPESASSAFSASESTDWSTPSTSSGEHRAIVALPPWARKGPDADVAATADAAPEEAPGAEPVPWWERNNQPAPTAAKPEPARYVPPPSAAPPASASLESTLARQAMRPKTPTMPPVVVPVVTRPAPNGRNRTLVLAAVCVGVAAIGTPLMWRLAFADKPATVSALQYEPAAAPAPAAPRPERVHGAPAAPRVYQDLQPVATPAAAPTPAASAASTTHAPASHAPAKPAKKPTAAAPTPEPVAAAPVAAPEPAPLLVATPTPVVASGPTTAAPPPAPVHAEAVPLGQVYEVSQVETRPSVTNRFDPVLPARITPAATPVVVIVRVLVAPSGRVVEASPVKNPTNDAGVGSAAAAVVRQWGFAPAKKKGQPVSCWVNVGVVFKAASGN